jgi:hypothetical protein
MKTGCAVYRHFDKKGVLLYVGTSADPINRYLMHRSRARWNELIATITIEWFPNRDVAMEKERIAIHEENPFFNSAGAIKQDAYGQRIRQKRKSPPLKPQLYFGKAAAA